MFILLCNNKMQLSLIQTTCKPLSSFQKSIHKILKVMCVCLCVSLNANAHMPWSVCRGQRMSKNVCLHLSSCLRQGFFGICCCVCQIIWP